MRLGHVLRAIGGSSLVYVVVAACAGGGGGGSALDDGGVGVLDALSDSITHPVGDAKADPSGSGSRLKAKYLSGSDGSKQFLFLFHDTARKEDCSFRAASDLKTRCLPGGRPIELYSDSACTKPVVTETDKCAYFLETMPFFGIADVCALVAPTPSTRVLQKSSTEVPVGTILYRRSSSCTSFQAVRSEQKVFTTTEVDPTSFVEATVAVEP